MTTDTHVPYLLNQYYRIMGTKMGIQSLPDDLSLDPSLPPLDPDQS
jgi:hypothetical protein